jgi:hypothetical protein
VTQAPGSDRPASTATTAPAVPAGAGQTRESLRIRLWRRTLVRLGADPAPPDAATVGRWPSTWQGFLWDLAPDELAPGRDGVTAPAIEPAEWTKSLDQVNAEEVGELLDLERRRHEAARATASVAEGKASRLLTPAVALLTGAVAFVGLQLNSAAAAKTLPGMLVLLVPALPGIVGVVYVVMSVLRALDADTRVGTYTWVSARHRAGQSTAALVIAENKAAARAEWTAQNKVTRLMYARAALSRAFAFIVLALALAAATTVAKGFSSLDHPAAPDRTHPAPAGSSRPSAANTTPPPSPASNPGRVAPPNHP